MSEYTVTSGGGVRATWQSQNPFHSQVYTWTSSTLSTLPALHLKHGGDTSWPKQFQNGGPQTISETLHIEYWIVCCIEIYLIHIYHMSKCSKCNWNRYIEGFCKWNVYFHINGLSPNIAYVILMSWPLKSICFLLSNYGLFSVQFSYHI